MSAHESGGAVVHTDPQGHSGHTTTVANPDNLFTRRELQQFDADDVMAGGTIGKMLALFFLYTVIVMSVVAWWTAHSIKGP